MDDRFVSDLYREATIITPDDAFVNELKSASSHIAQQYIDTDADCARIYEEFAGLVANYGK